MIRLGRWGGADFKLGVVRELWFERGGEHLNDLGRQVGDEMAIQKVAGTRKANSGLCFELAHGSRARIVRLGTREVSVDSNRKGAT